MTVPRLDPDSTSPAAQRSLLCSRPSDRQDEPMAGTGPKVPILGWLAVEHPGDWGSHSVADGAGLPKGLHAWIGEQTARLTTALAETGGGGNTIAVRPLLIRSAMDGSGDGNRKERGLCLHVARVGRGRWKLELPDLASLLATDTVGLLDSPPLDTPLILVCGHLERDRCCAAGSPVAKALRGIGPGEVWLSSHLGGHRYAPTLVTLPEGALYGRIELADVPELARHLEADRLWAERLRGRVDLPPVAQAADVALRLHLQQDGSAALAASAIELLEAPASPPEPGQTLEVRLRSGGTRYRVSLRAELAAEEVLASCGPPERLIGLVGQQWTAEKSADLPHTRPLRFACVSIREG